MTHNDAALIMSLLAEARHDDAEALARQWLGEGRHAHVAHLALGIVRYHRHDYGGAIDALQESISVHPTLAAWNNLGAAHRATGCLAEAAAAYEHALALDPGFADAAANYANVLTDRGRYAEAEAMARRAITNGARSRQVYVTLGNALFRQGDLLAAAAAYRTALAQGYDGRAVRNLGSALANLGRFAEAKEVYLAALKYEPSPSLHSSFLICLNYDPDMPRAALRSAHKAYEALYAAAITPMAGHANTPLPDRPLRIGYVSPDLCNHVVAAFMLPLMERHDRQTFDIHCYADVRNVDDTSRKFQAVSRWVQITGLPDERVAEMIRADGIDVLVDLAGHSPDNRQLVFARKPAPVQLSYVIGTGTTTGLAAMDGLIADSVLLPEGCEQDITERPLRLGRPFVAYAPPPAIPAVGPPPALQNGSTTFGYFGRPIRLNDRVVRVWSEILRACPGSRLRLDNRPFGAASTQEDVRRRFLAHGIPPDRLDLRNTPTHAAILKAYGEIDIALDPFPQNAGMTLFEALWMGVPVLTLADRPPVGRIGASLLGALDLAGWIARDEQEYVAKAIAGARDPEGLATLRAGLRARCERSALADIEGLTRAMEHLYREAWQTWCAAQRTRTAS